MDGFHHLVHIRLARAGVACIPGDWVGSSVLVVAAVETSQWGILVLLRQCSPGGFAATASRLQRSIGDTGTFGLAYQTGGRKWIADSDNVRWLIDHSVGKSFA